MALSPTIDLCYSDSAYTLTDTTGAYDAEDNTGGYGAPNDTGASITSATIVVTYHDGTTDTFDVTAQIPDSPSGDFDFTDLDIAVMDGIYQVDYTLVGPGGTYEVCIKKAFFPLVTCCVDTLVSEIVNKGIHNGEDLVYIHSVLEVHGLLIGLKNAALSMTTTEINNILATINRICDYYDGEYGCGCC